MKMGILADSHDNVPMVRKAVEIFTAQGVEKVLHAGDFIAPFAVAPLAELSCPVVAVLGNNDGERLGLERKFASFGGELHPHLAETTLHERRIAAVHYPELAKPLAASGEYDLVVYGHTHEIDLRLGEGRDALLLNPGEAGGWLTGRATVAVVDLESMQVEIVELSP